MAVKWSADRAVYREWIRRRRSESTREPSSMRRTMTAAADDVVDALDGLGSRVFNSVDDAKAFLISQGLVED